MHCIVRRFFYSLHNAYITFSPRHIIVWSPSNLVPVVLIFVLFCESTLTPQPLLPRTLIIPSNSLGEL